MTGNPRRRFLEVERIGEVTVVNFTDKKILDEEKIQAIGDDLSQLVENLPSPKILLNLSQVEYLSSSAIGKFISVHKKVNAKGGQLVFCGIKAEIYEIFELLKMHTRFNIQKDEQSALQVFGK
jgi:anti-sigma B factor antagonist